MRIFFVGGSMIDTDFRKELKYIKSPTFIAAGRYDGVSTPEYSLQYKKIYASGRICNV